jgi:hypothetical protein
MLFINLFLISFVSYASTELKNNHCIAKVSSKKYIENDFQASYPKKIIFSCHYTCKSNSNTTIIKGTSMVRVSSVSGDAKIVVCQGVKVKQVSWGWDFDGVDAFYGYSTNIKEIKSWAFKNIPKNNPYEVNLLYRLKETLMDVANGYYKVGLSGYEYYHDAARILSKIANELPFSTIELDKNIKMITKKPNMQTKQGLVSGILMSAAQFKIK